MIRKTVTVGPGCLGVDFFLHPENRKIDKSHVKLLASSMDSVSMTRPDIELLQIKGKLYILDGQHTITALSEGLFETRKFDAKIFDEDEIQDVPDYLAAKHKGKIWRRHDDFFITRGKSLWPKMAEARGLDIKHGMTSKLTFTWGTLLDAVAASDHMRKAGRAVRIGGTDARKITAPLWLEATKEKVSESLDCAAWWISMNKAVWEKRRISMLGTEIAAIGFYIYKKYPTEAPLIHPETFAADDRLTLCRGSSAYAIVLPNLMHALNYRKQSNILDIFGVTGR